MSWSKKSPDVRPNILTCFPKKHTPRPVQEEILRDVETSWDDTDVFVINAPVALGKSDVAYAIAKYAKRALIVTPTKILVDQYINDFPGMPYLKAKDDYYCATCSDPNREVSCHDSSRLRGTSTRPVYCADCPYAMHVRRSHAVPYLVCNYHVAMAHRIQRDVLIVDEAHNLIPFIQGMAERTLWQHKWNYPNNIYTQADLLDWLYTQPSTDEVRDVIAVLESPTPTHILERKQEEFGREDAEGERRIIDCIKLRPIDIRDHPPILWPKGKVKKIVLMSATVNSLDVESLGVGRDRGYRVTYLEASSPIPASRRPLRIPRKGINVSYREQDRNLQSIADYIKGKTKDHQGENGVVHLTYGLADKLKPLLDNPDYMWHTRTNRSRVYREFLSAPAGSGRVLMACGLYEGIDLKGDVASWQILTKVPWPSLADAAIKYRTEHDERWYSWQTLKTVLQFSGRVCRTPTDFGVSYILDSSYRRLEAVAHDLMPRWFYESLEEDK